MLKKFTGSSYLSFVLLLSLLCGTATTIAPPARAQNTNTNPQQRQRTVTPPRTTPGTKPTPTPTPARVQTPTPTPAPARPATGATQATPTPTPTPAPTPAARLAGPQTLEELRTRIRALTGRTEFAASHIAIKVASLDTGRLLYEENAGKWMQPASNLKLYTIAAALDRLTPDYRFVTSVYAPARPDQSGTVRGDLIIYGRGDPSYATRFGAGTGAGEGDYYRGIDELASRIVAAGVRRVEGDLVGDESYFTGATLPNGWEWDDLQWYYGAEVSALTVNDNAVDLSVKPGARVGDSCTITTGPATPLITIIDRTRTSERDTPRDLTVHKRLGENVIEISGSLPVNDRGYTASLAVTHPAMLFVSMLRASLERQGVTFTGRTRTVDARTREEEGTPLQVSSLVELAYRQSPPLSVIAAQTMKPSQNLYTELILRALGKATSTNPKQTPEAAGIEAVRNLLAGAGADSGKLIMLDGSGLSRANLVTADLTLALLTHMNRHRFGAVFRDSLPVAGVDGTLRRRMKSTPAMNNLRAKTGTLGSANSLSGYVYSAAGERLVFSLMINNPPHDADINLLDSIGVLLASFSGRS